MIFAKVEKTEKCYMQKNLFGGYDLVSLETGDTVKHYNRLPKWANKNFYLWPRSTQEKG